MKDEEGSIEETKAESETGQAEYEPCQPFE